MSGEGKGAVLKTRTPGRSRSPEELRAALLTFLEQQGFQVEGGVIRLPPDAGKETIRALHRLAVEHRRREQGKRLARWEPEFLSRVASGRDLRVEAIRPRLVEVQRRSRDELFFRWAALHWSIPVSSGYGRRLRFLLVDEGNEKVMGILGLGDPVFALAPRDRWIGWDEETKRQKIRYVMDAFVLGALPPYAYLLGGKLVAMAAASNEVREAFSRKYQGASTVIAGERQDGHLALLTTASALGPSSLYNRVRYGDRLLYLPVGYTRGFGEFHFSSDLYEELLQLVRERSYPTAKHVRWGKGFRNRREVVRKGLRELGLSTDLHQHGVRRQIFVVPLAQNAAAFLRGEDRDLRPLDLPLQKLFAYFKERWLVPRARRDDRFRAFQPEDYALWS